MLTDVQLAQLEEAWRPARAAGVLGRASVEELSAHAAGYLSAACGSFGSEPRDLELNIVDVGSGAGVPGVLLALALPGCSVVLLDSQERRCDLARHAVAALDLSGRVSVAHLRADEAGHMADYRFGFDLAVARLLGPPAETVELLAPLVADGGGLVVSSSLDSLEAWQSASLEAAGCCLESMDFIEVGGFVTLKRCGPMDATLPRRVNARRRRPLFG